MPTKWLKQSPGRTAFINEKEYLFFSGYSYLGMSYVPEFISLVKEGIEQYGLLFPSSRISNTRLNIYDAMETLLSDLTQQPETILYASGFLAGRAVSALFENERDVWIAPGTHPAINMPGIQLKEHWQQQFVTQSFKSSEIILVTDSVHPLEASITDFEFLKDISPRTKATIIIDDSHGMGLIGKNGMGISGLLPSISNVEYIIVYSLSKSFHLNGGAVSCSKGLADLLRKSPFYTSSTAMAPYLCHAFIHGQKYYSHQLKKLQHNIEVFSALSNNSLVSHPALPIFMLNKKFDQAYFDAFNIVISSFAYPDPEGETINRIVLNALHTEEDLTRLSQSIFR